VGLQVSWHRSLEEVPRDAPAIFIAHEFFDALPVHQFQKTERGWCERLVDVAGDCSSIACKPDTPKATMLKCGIQGTPQNMRRPADWDESIQLPKIVKIAA
jgi:SAM-dependent MidA family methyltransferase